ncbi:hypothetical protein H5202_21150 [Shewanella sp. SG41-4]|uniref:hypothetical protein n=1 Tax=Shewanella sp. SG41-4 TaxID=2760976 RepID=UPI0016015B8A|nr:hypothetical protein [Shewanella sp. SG41-4]MBB1441107.1 hypothetical protein [Shewanella sp. SG41-4]
MNADAFEDGRPPVEQYKDGRQVKFFSVDLLDAKYVDATPRQAAYLHLMDQPYFDEATFVDGVNV